MAERNLTTTRIDPRNPEFSLAVIFSGRTSGARLRENTTQGTFSNLIPSTLSLMVDSDAGDRLQGIWDSITQTNEFLYLQHAYQGDTGFFRETEICPAELILPDSDRRFSGFYNFLRSLAYERAIEQAGLQEEYHRAIELRLEARGNWTPNFRWYQQLFIPSYVRSIMTRVYNLVTTGEERPAVKDRFLDRVMA